MSSPIKRYGKGERVSRDHRSRVIPSFVEQPEARALLQALSDYRAEAERVVLAEHDFTQGEIGERDLMRVEARYDAARARLLAADIQLRQADPLCAGVGAPATAGAKA